MIVVDLSVALFVTVVQSETLSVALSATVALSVPVLLSWALNLAVDVY